MFWRKKEKYYSTDQVIEILESIISDSPVDSSYYKEVINITIKKLISVKE